MGVDALRTFAQGVMFNTIGVPIVITRPAPDDAPIETSGIWMVVPLDESRPVGVDFQRREPRQVLVIPRLATLPTLPRGTTLLAPELAGGVVKGWRVEGFEQPTQVDEWRVRLVEIGTP